MVPDAALASRVAGIGEPDGAMVDCHTVFCAGFTTNYEDFQGKTGLA